MSEELTKRQVLQMMWSERDQYPMLLAKSFTQQYVLVMISGVIGGLLTLLAIGLMEDGFSPAMEALQAVPFWLLFLTVFRIFVESLLSLRRSVLDSYLPDPPVYIRQDFCMRVTDERERVNHLPSYQEVIGTTGSRGAVESRGPVDSY